MPVPTNKKRGHPNDDSDMDGSDDDAAAKASMRKLRSADDFLEVGSVSWSILISLYFLTLHDDSKDSCISFESI